MLALVQGSQTWLGFQLRLQLSIVEECQTSIQLVETLKEHQVR